MNIYTEVPHSQIAAEKEYFISAIFKLLPYRQDGYEYLDNYFESVLQRLTGFNKLSGFQPEVVTIISLLEYAREENDFRKYRKAILDACGMVKLIRRVIPMLNSYRLRMATLGSCEGEARRRNSQKIMDASWTRDAATKPVYVKWVDNGLPVVDDDDIPVDAKYNVKSYHNITGDEVAYLLQFRLEDMKNRPDIKVGSYVKIPNEMDEYEWWLIWHLDDRPQFRQCSILKCTWIYKWTSFKDGHRVVHQCLGVTRNQNNYNSGCWLDYTFEVVEQQHVMLMPSNNDTNMLTYNTRLLVSNEGRYPPIAWKISKVQPSVVNDTVRFTMTQEQYNAAVDDAELMIADYRKSYIEPELPEVEEITTISDLEIVYSGSPAVRAGGGYKKFTLKARIDGELVDVMDDVEWSVDFGGNEDKLECVVKDNIFKVKCLNDYSLIGKTFTVTAESEHSSKSIVVEVTSL